MGVLSCIQRTLLADSHFAELVIAHRNVLDQGRVEAVLIYDILTLEEYAMTESGVDIGALITRSADIVGGRPRITGTGVSVQRIIGWYKLGLTAEEIVEQYEGHLSLAQIYAALSYYHSNQEEIDNAMAMNEQEADRLEGQQLPPLAA